VSDTKLPWFRMYGEAVDDEKLRLLAFEDRWHFVALLCCKTQGILDEGSAIMHRKVAVKLGVDMRTLEEIVRRLAEVELIDEKTLQPIAWENRQFKSDSSKERTQKYRERMKRHSDGVVTVQETDTEADTDTDTERLEATSLPDLPPMKTDRRKTRLPPDWDLPTTWMLWAMKERPELDVEAVSNQFRDYWVGTGKTMANWEAVWRNWIRREKSPVSKMGKPNANAALFASMTHLHQQPQRQPEEHHGRTIDVTPRLG